jgi:hypothetical protein
VVLSVKIKFMATVLFGCFIILYLFAGCINWNHVVEHNELRTLDEHEYDRETDI